MRKKFITCLLVMLMVLSGLGCSNGDKFKEVDEKTRKELLSLLETAALGGRGEYIIAIDGEAELGEVTGTITSSPGDCDILSISFFEGKYIEVQRSQVTPEGKWGPLVLVSEPRALVLLKGKELKGYNITKPRYAAMLTGGTSYSDFLVDPKETGLVALALIYGEKYQEAADLLAGLQLIHPLYSGLPEDADIFGGSLTEEVDYTATAWVGYATAVLASLTDNSDIWREANQYASYLEGISVPNNVETMVGGWLFFNELAKKDSSFSATADKWQPQLSDNYDPLIGLALKVSQSKITTYVDTAYTPKSAADRWIHYSLLASIGKLPSNLDLSLQGVPGGVAVIEDGKISLSASSWMFIALQGGLKN